MKRLSSRTVSALTNLALALILVAVAAVCFFPSAGPASGDVDRVFRRGNLKDGVSLMFNVYWGTDEVYKILDVLDEYGAKATFFLGGSWADDNAVCVREIAGRGHEIGSHGYFHLSHDKLSYEENVQEIGTSAELLSLLSGQTVSLFAPPSGAYGEETVRAAESMGLKVVLWSRDTVDWRDKDEEVCFARATKAQGGDLVLMHPMAHTVCALPRILKTYETLGLRAVTVGENLGEDT